MSRASVTKAWKLLLDGTRHADSFVRCDAARLLGDVGDRRAVPALTQVLKTDAHLTKITAVYALGSIGDRKAAPILRQIAADPGVFRFPGMHYHDMIRLAAAVALARWNDPSGVMAANDVLRLKGLPAMLELGQSILSAPKTAALKRLKAYIDLPFVLAFRGGKVSASRVFFVDQCLAFFPEAAARRHLIADLAHFSRYVRPVAAQSLLAQDRDHIRLVAAQARKERTPFARIRFAQLLHEHGAGDATAVVRGGLRDRDAFVRATAVDAVAALKLKSLAPAVVGLLADEDFYVRICAAAAVETLVPQRARALLLPLMSDAHPRVAIQAAKSVISEPMKHGLSGR